MTDEIFKYDISDDLFVFYGLNIKLAKHIPRIVFEIGQVFNCHEINPKSEKELEPLMVMYCSPNSMNLTGLGSESMSRTLTICFMSDTIKVILIDGDLVVTVNDKDLPRSRFDGKLINRIYDSEIDALAEQINGIEDTVAELAEFMDKVKGRKMEKKMDGV